MIPTEINRSGCVPLRFSSPRLLVKSGVHIVDVLLVHLVLRQPQALTETLEVDDLSGPQEADGVVHIRVVGQAQDVVIGKAGFLLRRQVLRQVGDDIAGDLHGGGGPGIAGGKLGIHAGGVVHEIGVEAGGADLVLRQVPGQLMDDGAHHLQVAQFLGTCIVAKIAHLKSVEKQRLFVLYASYSIYASDRLGQASIRLLAYV